MFALDDEILHSNQKANLLGAIKTNSQNEGHTSECHKAYSGCDRRRASIGDVLRIRPTVRFRTKSHGYFALSVPLQLDRFRRGDDRVDVVLRKKTAPMNPSNMIPNGGDV